jgi:hypothetical protein
MEQSRNSVFYKGNRRIAVKYIFDGGLMADTQRQLLSYTVLDNLYQNPSLKFILGEKGGTTGALNTLETNPADSGVPFPSEQVISGETYSQDPVLFSFLYGSDVRALMANIVTDPPNPSEEARYSLLYLPREAGGVWSVLARNILLTTDGSTPVATNPHGIAQVGNDLYIIDYDTQLIYQLGTNELNGLADGTAITLANAPFDVGSAAGLPIYARGQAIIALTQGGTTNLYALYIDSEDQTLYEPSVLVKLSVGSGGALTYVGKVEDLGRNAQEIIPVTDTNGITLLIPSIGGAQHYDGTTNGMDSRIEAVPAFTGTFAATILLTGDETVATPAAGDIHAIAASSRDNVGPVFILAGYYTDDGEFFTWAIYQTIVARLLNLSGQTISAAVTSGALNLAESQNNDGNGYFWDLFYELGDSAKGDRLWKALGTPVTVTLAANYNDPSAVTYARGMGVGHIGNANMNSADLTSEMIRQVRSGVSFKHGLRIKQEQRKAALKAAAKAATERKEEENK